MTRTQRQIEPRQIEPRQTELHRRPPAPLEAPPSAPRPPQVPAPSPVPADEQDRSRLARLHESMAGLHAARGQWHLAYQHLRSALDITTLAVAAPDIVALDAAAVGDAARGSTREPDAAPVPEQLRREVDRLRREHAEAREQSRRDSLTASYNRRYLDERLDGLVADVAGLGAGLAVALLDLDRFKQVNDTHGHLLGDRVLQRVVEVLQDGLPEGAFCARYGGEEFVLVLPGVTGREAAAVSETARARVAAHPWEQLAAGLRITVSIGVAHRGPGSTAPSPRTGEPVDLVAAGVRDLLRCADDLLYVAKRSGRNAVAHLSPGGTALAGLAARRRAHGESSRGPHVIT